jgi:hypothetical protein
VPPPATRADDLRAAERDYVEAVDILQKLKDEGSIAGTDIEYLDNARAELEKIRGERAQTR